MTMTPEAKAALSKTMRALRAELLDKLASALVGAYRLDLSTQEAQLDAHPKARRRRLDDWLDSRVGHLDGAKRDEARRRARDEVVHQAASTWLNRLVLLRLMEASGLQSSPVLTGGWHSRAYKDFREQVPALCNDESQGYQTLLGLVFGELAQELPGLFGAVGLIELVPMPPEMLRRLVEALDQPVLASCWTDDLTLGWVYQYWSEPVREELDAKLLGGGKLENHEIASKTQLFTDRYMVDWLLQNSLGPIWLAMCQKKGWTAEVQADGTLDRLEARRVDWRAKRDAEEVSQTALMPLHSDIERRWAYYVPQPIPEDAVTQAPDSVRVLKILDPAVGSGHFLVGAMDLLLALYREEARHRGEDGQPQWSDQAILESILENNLHGVDIDPRATQIAAAALWLKAKSVSPEAQLRRLNLVASNLDLASLPNDEPGLIELRRAVERETGIPGALTDAIFAALRGADHLGSLLKVDAAVDVAIEDNEAALGRLEAAQGGLFTGFPDAQREPIDTEHAKATILTQLEAFLAIHSSGEDLGLRLRGEQLAAGVRFVRIVKEGRYHLVVGNPPYQGTSKMADSKYIQKQYPLGKADLFAAFLVRALQLAQPGGVSAMLTMRNWMFIKRYAKLRESLLERFDLRTLGDLDKGAFEGVVTSQLVSVCLCVFRRADPSNCKTVALQPTAPGEKYWSRDRTELKRAAVLCQRRRFEFRSAALRVVREWPLIYWWRPEFLDDYAKRPKIGEITPAGAGISTGNNDRFLKQWWEVQTASIWTCRLSEEPRTGRTAAMWVPFVKGAGGVSWFEPMREVIRWRHRALEKRVVHEHYGSNGGGNGIPSDWAYFAAGVAITTQGDNFSARAHLYRSVISNKGSSLYPKSIPSILILLNSSYARSMMRDLNPGIGFELGDVRRLPALDLPHSTSIYSQIRRAHEEEQSRREADVAFVAPGPTSWRKAQEWAQSAINIDPNHSAPAPCDPEYDPEPPTDHLSYALGVALGRFGASLEGVLDPTAADISQTLPAGLLFLSAVPGSRTLAHAACALLNAAWDEHGHATNKPDLLTWLRTDFIKLHLAMYENKPIHWPLSSAKKSFVTWVNIHRMNADTLRTLLADHVLPEQKRLQGMIRDLDETRRTGTTAQRNRAEKQYGKLTKWAEELQDYIDNLRMCSEQGPPPPDAKTPPRDRDARYDPDLDDGVMINSAALWPLLDPQWKKPKKWWKELATAKKGNKDYDWSHLAARYWPERVDAKCKVDPSLGVAHGCFWKYHPQRAYAWELRLQDEIAPDFTIDEDDSDACRAAFLRDHPENVVEIRDKERKRRKKKAKKDGTTPKPLNGEPTQATLCLTPEARP